MKKRSFLHAAIYTAALAAALLLTCAGLSRWLDVRVADLCKQTYPYAMHEHGWSLRDNGSVVLDKVTQNGEIVFMGSSELNSNVPQIPRNMFPNNYYPHDAVCVGQACFQNYNAAMLLGSSDLAFQDNDLVLIESLQWFYDLEPDPAGFLANFSEQQFYRFLSNERISEENKQYLCKQFIRLYQSAHIRGSDYDILLAKLEDMGAGSGVLNAVSAFRDKVCNLGYVVLDGSTVYPQTYLLAKLYLGDSLAEKVIYQLLRPYFSLTGRFRELKDKFSVYRELKELPGPQPVEIRQLDWEQVYAEGERQGRESCTNNDLPVYDEYYDIFLRDIYDELGAGKSDVILMESTEWEDFQFVLNVCDDLGLKPYMVIMAAHGPYYDHIGVSQEMRDGVYDRISSMCMDHEISWFSMRDKEYEPYVYCDVMHLGWKGWPYVEESIINHFTE